VDLLKYFVDVTAVSLLAGFLALLLFAFSSGLSRCLLRSLLSLGRCLRRGGLGGWGFRSC